MSAIKRHQPDPLLANVDVVDVQLVSDPQGSRHLRIRYVDRGPSQSSAHSPPAPDPIAASTARPTGPPPLPPDPSSPSIPRLFKRIWSNAYGRIAVIALALNVVYLLATWALSGL